MTHKYYNENGELTESEGPNEELKKASFCFEFESEETPGTPHLYIKSSDGVFCDPQGEKPRTRMFDRSKFVHVSQKAFNIYLKYLQTKHNYLLVNARRIS
jgi:hypothetical protein